VTELVEGLELARVRDWLGCTRLRVLGAPGGGGWSSCTLLVDADDTALVLRLAPTGRGMFPEHDLSVQVRCLQHVRAHGLAAPAVLATDLDGRRLGRPGYAMERVAGRVPSDDDPPFTRAGFLFDATPAQRGRFSTDLVDQVASVHRLPPLAGLPVGPSTADHLSWCRRQRATPPGGDPPDPPDPPDPLERAHRVLAATMPPDDGPPVLLWGDARPANTVVDERFAVVALLDWELAGTGAAEFDVSWLNAMNRLRAGTDPPLPGFLTEDEVWLRWSDRTGRPPRARAWFDLFAAYRVAVLLELHLDDRVRRGVLPADHPVRTDNRARRRLAELLARH
jgi:aminoglycoside phosphotransferase (APT) family kinase protein